MSASREALIELLEPEVRALGYELADVDVNVGRGSGFVCLYIDKDGGVTVDDCARVSHQVSAVLDVEDPIPEHYELQVSSPGLNRSLRTREHFERFAGNRVKVELWRLREGRKRYTGQLEGVAGDEVVLAVDGAEVRLPIEGIKKARLAPVF